MNTDIKYATSFRRSTATAIDIWVVLILRLIVIEFLRIFWINKALLNFQSEFIETFGTETIKGTPEHISFFLHHVIFIQVLIFYAAIILIGTFYHACLNSSAWRATVGKRLMKIMITKEDFSQISLNRALAHYFLSILPFAYIIYICIYQMQNKLTFFHALTSSEINVFFGVVFVLWTQIHLFTKRKTTAYDLICKTIFIEGRTSNKFPWSK